MVSLSRTVRGILDAGGLQEVLIFASGNLDEYSLAPFATGKAPVDGFGIGSRLTTSADVPYFDCAYKLVEYKGLGRRKLSKGKATWPGRKQVFRQLSPNRIMSGDILALEQEALAGTPLLNHSMAGGLRCGRQPLLAEARDLLQRQLPSLPRLDDPKTPYPVRISDRLQAFAEEVSSRMIAANQGPDSTR